MAKIKTVTFSFDIPIETLLALAATGNAGMRVEVFEDNKSPRTPRISKADRISKDAAPALLEGPSDKKVKKHRGQATDANGVPVTAVHVFLTALARSPGHQTHADQIKAYAAERGLSPTTFSNPMATIVNSSWAVRLGAGVYKLTADGLRECRRQNIDLLTAAPPKSGKANGKHEEAHHHG